MSYNDEEMEVMEDEFTEDYDYEEDDTEDGFDEDSDEFNDFSDESEEFEMDSSEFEEEYVESEEAEYEGYESVEDEEEHTSEFQNVIDRVNAEVASKPNHSPVSEMSPELQAEYDATFSGEEKANNLLKLTSDKYTLERKTIKISDIGYCESTKRGRQKTVTGLTQTVKELGVLSPIHVMTTETADDEEGFKYILIDGMRRVFAAIKNGMTEIEAIVWDFKDKDFGADLTLALGLMINRQQKRQWSEVWDLYRILELQSAITPGTLEFLLQLESGDAMKLKDVMLCEYSEVKEALLSGEKSLDAAYKMLTKLRKEEDQLAKDDATGFSDTVELAEEFKGDSASGNEGQLTDQDVLELLEMVDSMDDEDVSDDDFNAMNAQADGYADQQKVGDRHPLDPALRQAVLARDDFTCKCCGMRMVGARLGLIAVHHLLPVHVGGKDVLENLTTLCLNCHVSLHVMERNGGSIMMSKEDFDKLLPSEQTSLKRALKLARIAIEADKRKGLSKEQVAEATKSAIKHVMPGVGMKENEIAYSYTQAHKGDANGEEE